jgi:hypothetical protein
MTSVAHLPEEARVRADAVLCADTKDKVSAEPAAGDPHNPKVDSISPAAIALINLKVVVIIHFFFKISGNKFNEVLENYEL